MHLTENTITFLKEKVHMKCIINHTCVVQNPKKSMCNRKKGNLYLTLQMPK